MKAVRCCPVPMERLEARTLLAGVHYTITDLGEATVAAINNEGEIAGSLGTQATVWRDGRWRNVGSFPVGTSSAAADINDRGDVIVSTSSLVKNEQSYLFAGKSQTDLGRRTAIAINSRGEVVLSSGGRSYLYQSGQITEIEGIAAFSSTDARASDINDAGAVVGTSGNQVIGNEGFLWTADEGTRSVGTLSGGYSLGRGINNHNQVVGQSEQRAFLWSASEGMKDLGVMALGINVPRNKSLANAINDEGTVVGLHVSEEFFGDTSFVLDVETAFVYARGTMQDLNNLVGNGDGVHLREAVDINNRGQIIGHGEDGHAYLLTPKTSTLGSIRGVVFNDRDGDGERDSNEKGVASRKVFIDVNNDGKRDTGDRLVRTGAQGVYKFTRLRAGRYRLRQVVPDGFRRTTAKVIDLRLKAGQVVKKANFGTVRVAAVPSLSASLPGSRFVLEGSRIQTSKRMTSSVFDERPSNMAEVERALSTAAAASLNDDLRDV